MRLRLKGKIVVAAEVVRGHVRQYDVLDFGAGLFLQLNVLVDVSERVDHNSFSLGLDVVGVMSVSELDLLDDREGRLDEGVRLEVEGLLEVLFLLVHGFDWLRFGCVVLVSL